MPSFASSKAAMAQLLVAYVAVGVLASPMYHGAGNATTGVVQHAPGDQGETQPAGVQENTNDKALIVGVAVVGAVLGIAVAVTIVILFGWAIRKLVGRLVDDALVDALVKRHLQKVEEEANVIAPGGV